MLADLAFPSQWLHLRCEVVWPQFALLSRESPPSFAIGHGINSELDWRGRADAEFTLMHLVRNCPLQRLDLHMIPRGDAFTTAIGNGISMIAAVLGL